MAGRLGLSLARFIGAARHGQGDGPISGRADRRAAGEIRSRLACLSVAASPIRVSLLDALSAAAHAFPGPFPPRSHSCGALNASHVGQRVVLAGSLLPGRKGKRVSFFPLKDSHGTTQLITSPQAFADLAAVPLESSVLVQGTVLPRPQDARRKGATGEIDVQVESFTVLNPASTLPFTPSNPFNLPGEDLRARFRYLDLRRTALSDNIKKRSQVAHLIRNALHDQGFIEVETPVLLRSSPEGAREFLVPTRTSHSDPSAQNPAFYALQQSPQQPKQLLICSGAVDRYFQLAKCFRDEDGRKDRQPEFTQVDLEMAYVSWGQPAPPPHQVPDTWRIGGLEIRQVVQSLIQKIWSQAEQIDLPDQFNVLTYREAMTRYGSDKPDTRFGLEIINITPYLPPDILSAYNQNEQVLEAIIVRKSADPQFIRASRSSSNDDHGTCHIHFSQTTASTWLRDPGLHCEILKGLTADDHAQVNASLKLSHGDDMWLSKRSQSLKGGSTALGKTRLHISELAQTRGDFTITQDPHFLWVTEFPLFTHADEDKDILAKGRWSSSHHPFTAPMWQDIEAMYRGDIEKVRGQHYDLVLNGVEIGGGSVRVHDAHMQDYIFTNILQLTDEEKSPFDQLLHALKCGAPPHGGIALGFDRLMAILCKTPSIRDVIAFPKSGNGTDLLFKSPSPVSEAVLHQYGLQSRRVERK